MLLHFKNNYSEFFLLKVMIQDILSIKLIFALNIILFSKLANCSLQENFNKTIKQVF